MAILGLNCGNYPKHGLITRGLYMFVPKTKVKYSKANYREFQKALCWEASLNIAKRRCIALSKDQNTVYVGRKPPMNYVTAIITSFTGSDSEDVTLKARGRSITTAIDAAEITRRRFMKELNIGSIKIGTEELQREEGGTKNVSTIEITLTRSPPGKEVAEERKGDIKTESVPVQPMELTSIVGVGAKRAEDLKSHGIQSVQDLAKLDAEQLSEKLKISEKRVSKWIDEAKEILKK